MAAGSGVSAARLAEHQKRLLVRGLSALVLVIICLAALFASGVSFLVLVLISATLVLAEWLRIAADLTATRLLLVVAAVAASLIAFHFNATEFAAGFAVAAMAAVVVVTWPGSRRVFWGWLGLAYVIVPALALLALHQDSPPLILWLFVIVWSTDIGAYLVGSAAGGPKLWPRVSPAKTWSGAVGGGILGCVAGTAIAFGVFDSPREIIPMLLAGLAVSISGQVGDLAESAWKRHFVVKDSGAMIPGHGGVMDRLDSLVPAVILVAIVEPVWSLGI